nr:peptidoglycan-binding protein [uncultured Pseudodesulfovibrio sp.]
MNHLRLLIFLLIILSTTSSALAQQNTQWPPDALDVSYTIAAKLSGERGLSTISFAPGTEDYLNAAASGEYNTFTRSAVTPVFYENYGTGNNYAAEVSGAIHLFDENNRLATMQYLAQYTVNRKRIHITQSLAAMSSPADLALETYMVPLNQFKSNVPADKRGDWATVYQFAKANGYNPQTDDDRNQLYLIMTFVMNRLPEDAIFEVVVSNRKKATRTLDNLAKEQESYLNYDGWRVHMFAANVSPTSMRERFFNNYFYTPGSGMPEALRTRTHVARYSSKPLATGPNAPIQAKAGDHATPQSQAAAPAPIRTTQPQQAYASPQKPVQNYSPATTPQTGTGDGPYGRGTAFLNPVFPEDVKAMQLRLRDLGYYKGQIDQNWGPMTRQALDNFAVKYGFPKGQWSLGLQKALFRGTGL